MKYEEELKELDRGPDLVKKGIRKLNKGSNASITDIITVLTGQYLTVREELMTEERRIQLLSNQNTKMTNESQSKVF